MGKRKDEITAEELRRLTVYNPENGKLYYRIDVPHSPLKAGQMAGGCDRFGIYVVHICGKIYTGRRLVWLYHHGKMPKKRVWHLDEDSTNTRVENLTDEAKGSYRRMVERTPKINPDMRREEVLSGMEYVWKKRPDRKKLMNALSEFINDPDCRYTWLRDYTLEDWDNVIKKMVA